MTIARTGWSSSGGPAHGREVGRVEHGHLPRQLADDQPTAVGAVVEGRDQLSLPAEPVRRAGRYGRPTPGSRRRWRPRSGRRPGATAALAAPAVTRHLRARLRRPCPWWCRRRRRRRPADRRGTGRRATVGRSSCRRASAGRRPPARRTVARRRRPNGAARRRSRRCRGWSRPRRGRMPLRPSRAGSTGELPPGRDLPDDRLAPMELHRRHPASVVGEAQVEGQRRPPPSASGGARGRSEDRARRPRRARLTPPSARPVGLIATISTEPSPQGSGSTTDRPVARS